MQGRDPQSREQSGGCWAWVRERKRVGVVCVCVCGGGGGGGRSHLSVGDGLNEGHHGVGVVATVGELPAVVLKWEEGHDPLRVELASADQHAHKANGRGGDAHAFFERGKQEPTGAGNGSTLSDLWECIGQDLRDGSVQAQLIGLLLGKFLLNPGGLTVRGWRGRGGGGGMQG